MDKKTQEIIDKHLKEFHKVQQLKVPIELNSYLHKIINEVVQNIGNGKNIQKLIITKLNIPITKLKIKFVK
jgi:hypothetical protein